MPPEKRTTAILKANTATMTDIEKLEACRQQLMEVRDLRSILEIRDRASAIKQYLRAKNEAKESQVSASAIIALAEARAGQLLVEGKKEGTLRGHGGDRRSNSSNSQGENSKPPNSIPDLGIDKNQSSRYQMAAEVLEKDPTWFDTYRGECVEKGWDYTQQAVIRRCRELRNEEIDNQPIPIIRGKYDVIVIDPPWDTTRPEFEQRAATDVGFDYPTMTEGELELLSIPHTDNCHVWVWTTQRFLPMALRLAGTWGMKYVCTFVWIKSKGMQPLKLPYYNCEFALYCRIGTPEFTTTKGLKTAYSWERKGLDHSQKPPEFYAEVVRVTEGKRIELFSRREHEGFESWGNEAPK